MNFAGFRVKIILFFFLFSIFALNVFGQCDSSNEKIKENSENKRGIGFTTGDSGTYGLNSVAEEKTKFYPNGTKPLLIISKPKPFHTEQALEKCIQGVVRLKITFFADGTVGKIKVIKSLPYGLTEKAIEAAKRIKFEPAMKRGKAISIRKTINYNFNIY